MTTFWRLDATAWAALAAPGTFGLVLIPDDAPTRVIHADHARRPFLNRLR